MTHCDNSEYVILTVQETIWGKDWYLGGQAQDDTGKMTHCDNSEYVLLTLQETIWGEGRINTWEGKLRMTQVTDDTSVILW